MVRSACDYFLYIPIADDTERPAYLRSPPARLIKPCSSALLVRHFSRAPLRGRYSWVTRCSLQMFTQVSLLCLTGMSVYLISIFESLSACR